MAKVVIESVTLNALIRTLKELTSIVGSLEAASTGEAARELSGESKTVQEARVDMESMYDQKRLRQRS